MIAIKFNEEGKKPCVNCKVYKSKESYYPSKSYKCGYRPECIECTKEKAKLYPKTREQAKRTKLKLFFDTIIYSFFNL